MELFSPRYNMQLKMPVTRVYPHPEYSMLRESEWVRTGQHRSAPGANGNEFTSKAVNRRVGVTTSDDSVGLSVSWGEPGRETKREGRSWRSRSLHPEPAAGVLHVLVCKNQNKIEGGNWLSVISIFNYWYIDEHWWSEWIIGGGMMSLD